YGSAELVLPQNAPLRTIEVAGIQGIVTQELESAAVELVGAGLGDYVYLGARVISVLGLAVVRDDAKFGDGVKVRDDAGSHVGCSSPRPPNKTGTVWRFPVPTRGKSFWSPAPPTPTGIDRCRFLPP